MANDNKERGQAVIDELMAGINLIPPTGTNPTVADAISEITSNSIAANPVQTAVVNNLADLVPVSCTAQEDYDSVFSEFLLGSTIRERAFYRIWRLRNTDGWRFIVGISGEVYQTWEELIKDIASNEALGIGRQIIFDRVKTYDQMEWMGYTHTDIIKKMSGRPSLYTRVLKKVVDWDTPNRTPRAIMLPASDTMTEREAKDALRDLIDDVESFPSQVDALAYIDQNLLLIPKVDTYMDNDCMVVHYSQTSVDTNGKIVVDDEGTIRFYPDGAVPDFVLDILKTKIH